MNKVSQCLRGAAWRAACVWLLGLAALQAGAQGLDGLPEDLAEAFKKQGFDTEGVGIYVREVGSRKPLLSVLADEPRNPASVIKLVTTAVALDRLGPAYIWKTRVYADREIDADGVLNGNLYMKGQGDPFITMELFWRFLRELRLAGLREIRGDVVLDTSYFVAELSNRAAFDGRATRSYNVNPSAMLVNFNSVRFGFLPAADGSVRVEPFPKLSNITIDNQMELSNGRCGNWKSKVRMQIQAQGRGDKVIFTGKYPKRCGYRHYYRVVSDSLSYFEGVFRDLWSEQGGTLTGRIKVARVRNGAEEIYASQSPPLAEIIRGVNKFSNNVMAKHLLLTLGAEEGGPPASAAKGQAVVKHWLRAQGLPSKEFRIVNGAGLARNARISAKLMGDILVTVYGKPYMPEFMSSMPIAAVDGTMRYRLKKTPMKGQMHIKTGSLNFVRSIAGYVLASSGKRYAVVMMHNHKRANTRKGQNLQDALLKWVYNEG